MENNSKTPKNGRGGHPDALRNPSPDSTQCKATTKRGTPCTAKATATGFCFFHSDPARTAELGRKGGQKNRHTYGADNTQVPPPQTAGDVKNFLAGAMADVRNGKMDPKLGSTLGYLGTSLLRAFEVADLDDRLRRLEETRGVKP